MGYFTETMNAIFETKGECKQDYALKRGMEKLSGDHALAKTMKDNKEQLRKERDHYNDYRVPMRTAQDYKDREDYANKAVKHANDMISGNTRDKYNSAMQATKEAFDSIIL